PVKVITDKAILESDPDSGELIVTALYPGVTLEDVKANVGWAIKVRSELRPVVTQPSPEELRLLRDVLDPDRLFLKS
ncbi:MAG: CoA-transferase subunit beta, partial [Gemmatimonadota bacterium]